MSYDSRHIDGDVNVGRNVAIGGDATVQGKTHLKGNVKIDGWLDARNIKGPNKGIFPDAAQLRKAYPLPHDGWWALVGDTLPAPLYLAEGGEWVATGKSAGNPTVDFNNPGPGKGLAGPQDKQSATAEDRLFVYATNNVTNGVAQSKATVLNCPDTLLKQKNGKLSLQKGLWNPDDNKVFVDDNEVPVATSKSDGAMSAADKAKMDSLPAAAKIATTENLDELSQRVTGVSDSSSAYTDPFISLGELANWQELSNTLNTLYEKKYMGRCRATVAGMNVEIYQFVQNFENKTFSQVVLGNVAPSEDGTQVVIKTVEHFDILARYCINEVWSAWESVSKQNIPVATPTADGLMSSTDKSKLDGYPAAGDFTFLSNDEPLVEADSITMYAQTASGESEQGIRIEAATSSKSGVMSAEDKQKVSAIGTGASIGHSVGIGFETEIGTGVRIDNMVQIKSFIDGNNKKVLILGTDKDASGVSIEKIGNFGVKIGSATLGGNSGYECYLGSGVFVGDKTFIGNECWIGDNTRIDGNVEIERANGYTFGTVARLGEGVNIGKNVKISDNTSICREHGIYVEDANIKIGEGVRISSGVLLNESGISTPAVNIRGSLPDKATTIEDNVQIGAGAQIGGIDISPSTTGLGTAVGIGNGVMIGNGVRLFNVVKDNATYHTFGKSIIGDNAKVYGVVGTDTTIGTEVGIGNGVKIDEGMWITKDGSSGFYLGTENHKVYLDKGDSHDVKIGSAIIGADVTIGANVTIEKNNDRFLFGTDASLGRNSSIGRNSLIGEFVHIKKYTSGGYVPTDYIFGESQDDDLNVVISNEKDIGNSRYRLGTGDTSSYIGTNVHIHSNADIGENSALGNGSGMDGGIYISATSDRKLHIGGDAGQDVYLGRPSYLGIGARVEDGVHVDTNVTVDLTNSMNEIVLGEGAAYRIGTSIVGHGSGVKIGDDIRIGQGVTIGDPATLGGWTGVYIGDGVNIGYGVDIEKDGYDIHFMRRMPDNPDITLKSGSYLGGAIYDQTEIGTGVVIKKTDGNNFSIGSSYLGDNSYLGESSKMWRDVEIGTAVKIVGVNITGYGDRVVISNGEGKTITLNWDN